MSVIGGYIVGGIIDLAVGLYTSEVQGRETNKQRQEGLDLRNRDLSQMRRQNNIDNKLAKRQLAMSESDLSFANKMQDEQEKDSLKSLEDNKKMAAGNRFRQSASNLFDGEDRLNFRKAQVRR